MPHTAKNSRKKLEKLENFESCRAALQEQLQKTEQKLDAAAHNLSKIRRNYAKRLETQIIEGLRDLNFLHVAFEISFEKTKSYTENGTDAVEFLISTNRAKRSVRWRKLFPAVNCRESCLQSRRFLPTATRQKL